MTKIDRTVEQLSFEKARFEYCAKMYEQEAARKEILERKSQFYLSFVTLFLGAIFLNLDFLEGLGNLISQNSNFSVLIDAVYLSIVFLAVSLLVSSIAVLGSIRLQLYKNEYPANFVSSLFSPDTEYLENKTEASLLKATAMSYAIALELNREINVRKAKWVKVASIAIFAAVISLMVFLSLIAALSLTN